MDGVANLAVAVFVGLDFMALAQWALVDFLRVSCQ
jgi:hypothetical protein